MTHINILIILPGIFIIFKILFAIETIKYITYSCHAFYTLVMTGPFHDLELRYIFADYVRLSIRNNGSINLENGKNKFTIRCNIRTLQTLKELKHPSVLYYILVIKVLMCYQFNTYVSFYKYNLYHGS